MPYQPFIYALLWNALNVFLYKILLQTHQACLFYSISKELFGISGTLFSTIYLLINFTNFGFDYSLFTFYRYYSNSQTNFKLFIKHFIIRTLFLILIALCLITLLKHGNLISQISFITQHIPFKLIPLLAAIFIAESLKKSLELCGQLSFFNRTITLLEIITLTSYITIVWSFYWMYGYIDLFVIFIPMAITSWIELCMLIKRFYSFYQTLPLHATQLDARHPASLPPAKTILINQAINYINQITKAVFSPNFIIIFLAYHLGMTKAGYIKLVIDIIILLYMLLNRAVGIPSAALLSKSRELQSFTATFLKITNGYIQFLYALAITLAVAIGPCIIKSSCLGSTLTSTLTINILLFTFAGFLEYVIITYEKLYLTQGASAQLAIINCLSFALLLPTLYASHGFANTYLLVPFLIIRTISASMIAYIAYRTWHVFPSFKIHPKTVGIASAISIPLLTWHMAT